MKANYLKENFEPIVKSSKNYTEILQKMKLGIKGNSRPTLKKYIKLYDIDISHFNYEKKGINNVKNTIPLEMILISGSTYTNVGNIKNRLYRLGIKERRCEKCGQDENWHGEHMSLILDHINGINNDHRIENIRIVCPNCNATLITHCRGKKGYLNKAQTKKVKVITFRESRRKVNRPSLEIILENVKELGFSATGRKYGVSDNAVRKWIKYYEKSNSSLVKI